MSAGQVSRFLPNNEFLAAINANAPSAANPFATIADLPTSSNIYNTSDSLTGNRVVTMAGNSLDFTGGAGSVLYLDPTGKVGINGTTSPGYALQVETGDFFLKDGVMGINESPDPTTRLRITSTGAKVIGARVDMSYTTQTGVLSGLMIRSTTVKSGASSTLLGVNSLLQGSATAGIHSTTAGSFRSLTTTGGTATVENIGVKVEAGGGDTNYGIQFQDGTEGLNKVLAMVTADGKINAVDVNTLITAPNTIYTADDSLAGNRTVTMAANNLTFSSTTGDFRFSSTTNANQIFADAGLGYTGIGIAPTAGNGTLQVFQPESATAPAIYVDMDQATNAGVRKAISVVNTDASYGGGSGAEQWEVSKHNTSGYVQTIWRDLSGTATAIIAGLSNFTWFNQNVTIGASAGQNQNKLRVVGAAPTSGITTFAVNNPTDGNVFTVTNRGGVFMNLPQRSDADLRWSSASNVNAVYFDASNSQVGIGVIPTAGLLHVENIANSTTDRLHIQSYTGNGGTGNIAAHIRGNVDNSSADRLLKIQHSNPAGGTPTANPTLLEILGGSSNTTDGVATLGLGVSSAPYVSMGAGIVDNTQLNVNHIKRLETNDAVKNGTVTARFTNLSTASFNSGATITKQGLIITNTGAFTNAGAGDAINTGLVVTVGGGDTNIAVDISGGVTRSDDDFEVTSSTKGIILEDRLASGNRCRVYVQEDAPGVFVLYTESI